VEWYVRWQERWRDLILTGLLVLLALEVFADIPLARTHITDAPLLVVVWFLSAVLVAARHWAAIAAIILSSLLALVANVERLDEPSPLTICLGSGSTLVFMAALIWVVWRAVFGPGRVTHHRIQGAVVIYLNIALSFAALYEILVTLSPGAISGVAARGGYLILGRSFVYYSLATITTTRYGDMVPIAPLARSISNLEALIGQLFPATLLARIVTLELQGRPRGAAQTIDSKTPRDAGVTER
jgi:hypothetical protein